MPLAFKMNLQGRIFKHHCQASKLVATQRQALSENQQPTAARRNDRLVSGRSDNLEVALSENQQPTAGRNDQLVSDDLEVACERLHGISEKKATDLGPPTPPQLANRRLNLRVSEDASDEGISLGSSLKESSATPTGTSSPSSSSDQQLLITNRMFLPQNRAASRFPLTSNNSLNTAVPHENSEGVDDSSTYEETELLLGREQYYSNRLKYMSSAKNADAICVLMSGRLDAADCRQRLTETNFLDTIPEDAVVPRQVGIGLKEASTPAPIEQVDVCLELNIGPGDVHAKKLLPELHSERRSGFSKWRRPENVTDTRTKTVEMPRYWLKNLDVAKSERSEALVSATLKNPNYSACNKGAAHSFWTTSQGLEQTHEDSHGVRNSDTASTLGLFLDANVAASDHMGRYIIPGARSISSPAILTDKSGSVLRQATSLSMPWPHWLVQSLAKPLEPSTACVLQGGLAIEMMDHQSPLHCCNPKMPGVLESSAKQNPEKRESFQHDEAASQPVYNKPESDLSQCSELTVMEADEASDPFSMMRSEYIHFQGLNKVPIEIPSVHERTLVEFLRAKKQRTEHFLDKIVVNADVYQRHPWHYTWGDVRGSLYFCCITKYSRRGNMTRDRMTKEGGRWKQQGMVQPILTAKGYDAASKTYLSYIPRGKSNCKGYFIPTSPGRVKHRHRMIEIALEEDLKSEKRYLKLKVTPKPFLVICVLRKA